MHGVVLGSNGIELGAEGLLVHQLAAGGGSGSLGVYAPSWLILWHGTPDHLPACSTVSRSMERQSATDPFMPGRDAFMSAML